MNTVITSRKEAAQIWQQFRQFLAYKQAGDSEEDKKKRAILSYLLQEAPKSETINEFIAWSKAAK